MRNILLFFSIVILLILGKNILIPIVIALFLVYLINAISVYYRKLFPSKLKKYDIFFNLISKLLAILSFSLLIYILINQIEPAILEFSKSVPALDLELKNISKFIKHHLGFYINFGKNINVNFIATSVISSIANFVTSFGIILIYMIFIFIEQNTFPNKLQIIIKDKNKYKKLSFILNSIDKNIKKYIFIKTILAFSVSVLSYICLSYFNITFAIVLAFIVFVLNFIPTFGSILSTIIPTLFTFILTQNNITTLAIFIFIGLVHLLFNNIIEPKLIGKTLNLSPFVILINLVFWGTIWGVTGLIFSVPILVATFIITAQFDSLRWVSVLLSENGEIPDKCE